jgi:hypothetical protein
MNGIRDNVKRKYDVLEASTLPSNTRGGKTANIIQTGRRDCKASGKYKVSYERKKIIQVIKTESYTQESGAVYELKSSTYFQG